MKIVIDTSAIIAVIAAEPVRESLIHLTFGSDLIAPGSAHWEIGNAFSSMLKRDRISLEQALAGIQSYHSIPIRRVEIDLPESLRLAERLDIYAYDAYLLRCAEQYSAPLLTLDRILQSHAKMIDITLLQV